MTTKDVNTMKIAPKVWHNGEFIDWNDARVHVMTHTINYGSSVFEGIRAYPTERGTVRGSLAPMTAIWSNTSLRFRIST